MFAGFVAHLISVEDLFFMKDPLATYLHDHLAGASFAIQLLEALRDSHPKNDLGKFATDLLSEVREDRDVLQKIADEVGEGESGVKEWAAWVGLKAGQFKFMPDDGNGLGTFEALETLALGILGKLALWRALELLATSRRPLGSIDLERLTSRAKEQFTRVEERRLSVARTAFAMAPAGGTSH